MPRQVLVTGGAGFIGSHLVRALVRRGDQVRVLDDLSLGRRENLPPEVQLIEGDVRNAQSVLRALEGVDLVYHLAARVSIRASMDRFADDASVNVMGTLTLLEAIAKRPVERVVLASSMGVYADARNRDPIGEHHLQEPIAPYGVGKLATEKYLAIIARQHGIRAVALRYFNTYGPGQTFTPYVGVITIFMNRLLANESPIVYGDGLQTRDFVSVHDVVAANLLAAEYAGVHGVFNVGSGLGRDVLSVATLLRDQIAPALPLVHAPAHAGEIRYSVADISLARRELGFIPRGHFEEDMRELVAAQRTAHLAR